MSNNKEKRSPVKWIARFVTRKPLISLALALILVAVMVPGLKKLGADFSYRIWFEESDALLKEYDAFERRFGNDETVVILVHSPSGIFDRESVQLVQQLTAEMWQVPEIMRVDSLSNYNWTHAEGDDIIVEPLLPEDEELTPALLAQRKQVALSHEVIPDYLVSRDGKTAVVYGAIKPSFEGSPDYQLIIHGKQVGDVYKEGVRDKISNLENKGDHVFHITGSGAISDAFREASTHDMQSLVPVLLAVIVFFILLLLRRVSALFLAFSVIILTIVFTFGFAGLAGIKFNNVIATLPNTLIAISIADAIHILVTFFQYRRGGVAHKETVYKTLLKNIRPTFLTSISTAIGFFSFFTAKVLPISNMGYLAAAGVMGAWVITIFFMGALLTLIPLKIKQKTEKSGKGDRLGNGKTEKSGKGIGDRLENGLENARNGINEPTGWAWAFSGWLANWKVPVIAVFVVLTLVSLYVGLQNEVNSDPFKYFPKGFHLRTANDFMNENVGGASGIEIAVDSGKPDGIKEPAFLKKVERYQKWLATFPQVTNTISIVDILKQTNRSLHGDNPEYYRLPDTREATAQQLFLYSMSLPQGMDLNDRMSVDNDAMRITVRWTLSKSKEATEAFAEFKDKAAEIGLNVSLTGKTLLYQSMNGYVVSSFIASLSFAIIFIGLLMIITFRSFRTGLLAMVPNIVPLFFGAALMTILGKPLDIGTVIVTSICLGIAVDDSIHFLTNFNYWKSEGYDSRKAVAMVLSYTGPALLVTTLILVAGFGTFAFAFFVPNINFGILTALILSVALITDLVLLPAIVMLKLKQEQKAANRKLEGKLELAPVRVK